ncbi:hypothetical protein AAG570_003392 [Ranatra chinensis]|uniref:Uncharacterized protein n=1 Tax=Ranatra chinensis TaxID=642074 RepID=A0ABD0Y5R5_9HEMI
MDVYVSVGSRVTWCTRLFKCRAMNGEVSLGGTHQQVIGGPLPYDLNSTAVAGRPKPVRTDEPRARGRIREGVHGVSRKWSIPTLRPGYVAVWQGRRPRTGCRLLAFPVPEHRDSHSLDDSSTWSSGQQGGIEQVVELFWRGPRGGGGCPTIRTAAAQLAPRPRTGWTSVSQCLNRRCALPLVFSSALPGASPPSVQCTSMQVVSTSLAVSRLVRRHIAADCRHASVHQC